VDEILSSIANKIDIDAIGSDGRNALHWACTLNRTSICHVLLKKGASMSKKDVSEREYFDDFDAFA
jgi:ankyrin repeat protein